MRPLRIGIPRSPFFEQLDPEIDAAVKRALEVLVGLTGGPTRDVTIAAPDTYAVLDAETYAYHAPLLADAAKRALYKPLTLQRIMGGASVTAQVYIEQRRRMQIARNTIGDVFADVDVLVAPTCMALPQTIADGARESRARAFVDPQHAAVQRLRHSRDQRAVRLHARRVADRHADHRPAARRSARARAGARLRAGDGLASARAAALEVRFPRATTRKG